MIDLLKFLGEGAVTIYVIGFIIWIIIAPKDSQ